MTNENTKPTQNVVRLLRDGYSVPEQFYGNIKATISDVIPGLDPRAKYKTEHLIGTDSWGAMSRGDRRTAGRCLSHMVAAGELPLEEAPQKHEYPKWYRAYSTA